MIIGDRNYIEHEWQLIQNFPRIWVLDGFVLNRANLRAVSVDKCFSCVVASALYRRKEGDHVLSDKEAILCTLNIKSMPHSMKITQSPNENPEDVKIVKDMVEDVHIFTEICNVIVWRHFFVYKFVLQTDVRPL